MPDKSGGKTTRIIQNVLVNWVAYAVTIVVGFFLSPFLVHELGDPVYGVWILLGSLTGYLGLLDFGITPSIVKSVAEYRAKDDQAAINRLVTGGMAVFVVLGSLSFCLSCILAIYFNDIFNNPLNRSTSALLVLLTGLNLALALPASVFIGVLRGYQRYDIDAAVSAVAVLVRAVVIVVLLRSGYGIVTLAAATLTFDLARLAYLIRCVYRINPAIQIARVHFDRGEMRRLSGYSSYFFLIAIGHRINFMTDAIVIGIFLSAAAVTMYSIPNRLVMYLRELVIEMTGVLMPAITHLHIQEATARVRELHVRCTKYVVLLALPTAAIFWILGDSFITLWMGPGYEEGFVLLQILTIGIVAHLLGTTTESVLIVRGRHAVVARVAILQALTNLLLSLFLVRRLGLVGIALGTTISMAAFFVWSQPVYFRHYLQQPLGAYLRQVALLPLLAQAPLVALLLAIKAWLLPTSLLMFFALTGLALLPYGVLAFLTCLGPDERRTFTQLAGKFGLKLAPRPT